MKKPELDQQDKYIKALMDISRAITSDQYLEDILKLILMVTAKVTGVEICSLWLIVGYRSAAWTRGNPCVRLPRLYYFQKSFKPFAIQATTSRHINP